jgi:hypothetical protein
MKKLIVVLSILALTVSANADLLAAWDINGVNAAATPVFTNTTSLAGITSNSTVLRLGAGITASGTANTFGGTSWSAANYADAVSSNDYISWFLQADSGFFMTVTNISFGFQRSATGPSNMVLQSSFDGFSANLFASNGITGLSFSPDFGLSLAGSNSVEFRIYGFFGASPASGLARHQNNTGNDISIQGTVIPEPGSMALMGLGLLGLAYLRRKIG